MVLSPSHDASFLTGSVSERNADLIDRCSGRVTFLRPLQMGVAPIVLELLVALSGMLGLDEFRRLGPLLWNLCLEKVDSRALPPVSLICIWYP